RERFSGGAEDDFVEGVDVERLFRAYVNRADAALIGNVNETSGGIDRAGGANNEKDGGTAEFVVDALHIEGNLAEPDNMRADGLAATFAGGELVRIFVEGLIEEGFRRTLTTRAARAARFEQAAVHVMDAMRARALVEIVDVLCAEVETVGVFLFD